MDRPEDGHAESTPFCSRLLSASFRREDEWHRVPRRPPGEEGAGQCPSVTVVAQRPGVVSSVSKSAYLISSTSLPISL
jgi:hypothetical protein